MIIGVLLVLAACTFFFFRGNKEVTGTVVVDSGRWGIEPSRRLFKSESILLVDNLPAQLQQPGINVQCNYKVQDVIGTSNWSTVVQVAQCKQL